MLPFGVLMSVFEEEELLDILTHMEEKEVRMYQGNHWNYFASLWILMRFCRFNNGRF